GRYGRDTRRGNTTASNVSRRMSNTSTPPTSANRIDMEILRGGEQVARCAVVLLPHALVHFTSVASSVISALKSLETGHPALALAASDSKVAWSAPGTFAWRVRWTAVMA